MRSAIVTSESKQEFGGKLEVKICVNHSAHHFLVESLLYDCISLDKAGFTKYYKKLFSTQLTGS
jgi:hypothetical protein